MKARIVTAVILITVMLAAVIFVVMPYMKITEANKALEESAYETAIEKYESVASNLFFKGKAEEGIASSKRGLAEKAVAEKRYQDAIDLYLEILDYGETQRIREVYAEECMQEGDYKKAFEMYDRLRDEQKAQEARNLYGLELMKQSKFFEAIDIFTQTGNDEKVKECRIAWAEEMTSQGMYLQAAEQYEIADMPEQRMEMYYMQADKLLAEGDTSNAFELVKQCAGEKCAQYLIMFVKADAENNPDKPVYEIAREYGSYFTDVNTQLAYCRLLQEEGIGIESTYPDGVVVDISLAEYRMDNYFYENITSENPDCSKILVFSREEEKPELSWMESSSSYLEAEATLDKMLEKRVSDDYPYTVRLQPALMNSFYYESRASSMEECTAIILFEKGFLPNYQIIIKTTNSPGYITGTYTYYSSYVGYDAYEGIMIYDVNDPLNIYACNGYMNVSLISGSEIKNSAESGSDITADGEWGELLYIPETDAKGNQTGKSFSIDDRWSWYNEKYMFGKHEEDWFQKQLDDGEMEVLSLCVYLLSR